MDFFNVFFLQIFKNTYKKMFVWECVLCVVHISDFFSDPTLIHNGAVCSFINDPHQNRGQQLSTRGFFYENCFSYMRSKYHYQERIFGSVEFLFWAILLALFRDLHLYMAFLLEKRGKNRKRYSMYMYIWILFLCFFVWTEEEWVQDII